MLYYPWRDEKTEIDINDIQQRYSDEKINLLLNVNKECYESVDSEQFEKAIEQIEELVVDTYEDLMDNDATRISKMNERIQAINNDELPNVEQPFPYANDSDNSNDDNENNANHIEDDGDQMSEGECINDENMEEEIGFNKQGSANIRRMHRHKISRSS